MFNFSGKKALVTGGSRGIGKVISLRLAEFGAEIAINYLRNTSSADETASEIERKTGKKPLLIKANVSDEEGAIKITRLIKEKFGKINIIVCNAASGVLRPFWETDIKHFKWTLEINAFGFINIVKNLLPIIENGKVIVISSLGAVRAIPNYTLVGMSKGAIESAVRHLALELSPRGINVNGVSPGVVDTDALKHFPNRGELLEESRKRTPLGRLTTPEDVADVVAFLASDYSKMIQGQIITVDGGYSILA